MVAEPTNRPEPRYGSATIPKLLSATNAHRARREREHSRFLRSASKGCTLKLIARYSYENRQTRTNILSIDDHVIRPPRRRQPELRHRGSPGPGPDGRLSSFREDGPVQSRAHPGTRRTC